MTITENQRVAPPETTRFIVPSAATLFERYQVAELPFSAEPFIYKPVTSVVSTRRKLAGKAFQRARERRGLTKTDLRHDFKGETNIITIFEDGVAPLNLPPVLGAAEKHFTGEDFDIQELRSHTEDELWIQTLTQKGMTVARAIKLLRLYNLQKKTEFANDAGINGTYLSEIELGHREPRPSTLNQLITASSLDPEGIPAQIIRLINEKRDPMSLTELQTCSFGEIMQYIRQLKGLSPRNLGNLLRPRKLNGVIVNIEKSKKINDKELDKKIIAALGVNPKSALMAVINEKIEKPGVTITQELIEQVFTGEKDGQFVFAEHIYEAARFPQPKPDKLLTQLDSIKEKYAQTDKAKFVVNALLTYLRKKSKKTQLAVVQDRELTKGELSRIERNKFVPEDLTIIKILNGLGYDLHDPITAYILNVVESLDRKHT
jgi:transcriptional regulator with XRE-family HTH domain